MVHVEKKEIVYIITENKKVREVMQIMKKKAVFDDLDVAFLLPKILKNDCYRLYKYLTGYALVSYDCFFNEFVIVGIVGKKPFLFVDELKKSAGRINASIRFHSKRAGAKKYAEKLGFNFFESVYKWGN